MALSCRAAEPRPYGAEDTAFGLDLLGQHGLRSRSGRETSGSRHLGASSRWGTGVTSGGTRQGYRSAIDLAPGDSRAERSRRRAAGSARLPRCGRAARPGSRRCARRRGPGFTWRPATRLWADPGLRRGGAYLTTWRRFDAGGEPGAVLGESSLAAGQINAAGRPGHPRADHEVVSDGMAGQHRLRCDVRAVLNAGGTSRSTSDTQHGPFTPAKWRAGDSEVSNML